MARGRRTSYTRDNRGRFASSPGGGGPKRSTPATRRAATRAGNRLNRDNSGRITGIGRDGATVRGGRIRTAKGNRRATQIASMRPAGFRSGTIARGGRGVRGSVARSLAAVRAAGGRKAVGLSRARPGQEQRAMQRVGGAGTVLQRRDNAEAQRVAASGGRRTSRKAAINRRMYNSVTTAIRARYAIDNPGKQRRYSTVKNPGPAGVSALTTKAPRLTAKASQPSPQTRAKRPASTVRKPSGLRPGALAARQQPQKPSKKPAKPARARRSKPDLSQGSFERRARATEKRAKAAERVVSTVDRFNPANRRLVNRANSLRSAADSYAYYARRGKNDPDFSAADLFKGRSRGSTAPRLTRSEKAAATRRAKADKRFRENVRRMEQDRRR
jgi:hypothetical protein